MKGEFQDNYTTGRKHKIQTKMIFSQMAVLLKAQTSEILRIYPNDDQNRKKDNYQIH